MMGKEQYFIDDVVIFISTSRANREVIKIIFRRNTREIKVYDSKDNLIKRVKV